MLQRKPASVMSCAIRVRIPAPPQSEEPTKGNHESIYLGVPIEAHDVANMMTMLKLARTRQGYKRDTCVDAAGYVALGGELHRDAAERATLSEREG